MKVRIACAALCVLAGCYSKVNTFEVNPRHICPGRQIEVRWDVTGSATLTATPPVDGITNGPVADEGRLLISPKQQTAIVVDVTRFLGKPSGATKMVELPKLEPLTASVGDKNASPGCGDGKVWATVHVKRFAPDILVGTVSAHEGDTRTYEVEHDGLRATVAPGTPSSAFVGRAVAGDWLLRADLQPGQVCGTPTIPNNVVVDVDTNCH
jgi:hypothetical protein